MSYTSLYPSVWALERYCHSAQTPCTLSSAFEARAFCTCSYLHYRLQPTYIQLSCTSLYPGARVLERYCHSAQTPSTLSHKPMYTKQCL